ncbi:MAG TPA: aminotransferase class I/II-fold pyridoxal phosphate-dependent enzyme [Oscillospiraceae bacterium]|nr:aminotransferase class I/II-fold pyridoxal phosphate-dependent enzyme [Oscillospiraceae bacterium]
MEKRESTVSTERELPLVSALETVRNRHSFHMPGNRAGRSFSAEFRTLLTYLDTTELDNTGDINEPNGAVLRALELAAKTFGSAQTYFITCGTTTSLRIALAGAFKPGDRVLIGKGSHLSVANSCALLGLEAVLIKQDVLPRFADGQVSEAEVLRSLEEEEDLAGVLVTTPGYYGENLPLERICLAAHALGIPVIVDSAHGAHFAIKVSGETFGEKNWPRTALSQGADMVAQSAHKTLPALTPASMLHLSQAAIESGRVSSSRLAKMLPVFQTSSPSFPVAASLDFARDFIDHDAAGYVSGLLDLLEEFVAELPPELSREYVAGDDPCRLVIDYSASNCSRQNVFKILDAHEVDVELIDARCIVCILPLDTPRESFIALGQACQEIARDGRPEDSQVEIDLAQREAFLRQSRTSLTLRESFSAESKEMNFRHALGQRSAGVIAPYPPGVPLLWPGEEITAADIALWQDMLDLAYDVRGIKSGKVEVLVGK